MSRTDRYSRQELFEGIGPEGQARLGDSKAVIIGCGALGSIHAETLARAGVGRITLIDRDLVEDSNLQRQILFEEADAREGLPKTIAAANRLARVNPLVHVEPVVADVTFENIEDLIRDAGVVLDGTDNFETRFLINDAAIKLGIPWVYGAAVGSYGLTMTIVPGKSPCLRCVLEAMPEPGSGPTCDTAGVIMPIVMAIGAVQSAEALKVLTGALDALHRSLIRLDLWDFRCARMDLSVPANWAVHCPACGHRQFDYLQGTGRQIATSLCGRSAVQVTSFGAGRIDFPRLAGRLRPLGDVSFNDFLLRFKADGYEITVFPDARGIIRGTGDVVVARNLYSRYIGT
ncbi:MAG TPA: ThiF family adenylyltransferase [Blastocatellia bacterium]|nr:ThiF family adenylyltransferase [Blastocatellia bacterium]